MKKIVILFFLFTGMANAEIKYDYKNSAHQVDKKCIAILSIMRDGMYNENKMDDYLLTTELQNKLILNYQYSKQLNTHVEVFKSLAIQKIKAGEDFSEMAVACVSRAGNL